ncbi:hypothetical protein OEB94_01070 [Streptomyces sp. ICN988]|uniref:hypothetical protein n=1 Tax=Streptomyces sp. ICN988 TaxID=2983765 RepID=UPI0021E3D766|nr:hypothetical protein [Streptomyces sp. ICN988]MCV2457890.1 hypothetical protein [Streptomyces sp. ICN988]
MAKHLMYREEGAPPTYDSRHVFGQEQWQPPAGDGRHRAHADDFGHPPDMAIGPRTDGDFTDPSVPPGTDWDPAEELAFMLRDAPEQYVDECRDDAAFRGGTGRAAAGRLSAPYAPLVWRSPGWRRSSPRP